jgi:cytochrome d ubiquinol oxidase subunit I
MTQFWSQIFAINFGLGVATGLVMEFQFGTNWAVYSRFVGDIFGSALAAEGIFAFFLESGFLAIVIFGWEKVSARLHLFATMMVAFGAIFSAFWITVANSWQQTPVAYHLVRHGGQIRAELTDYWAMIFNPSSMDRFSHVIVGSWILGAFFVMSICAYYLLQKKHLEFAKRGFIIAMIFAAALTPLQLFIGSHQAKTVTIYQPAKLAAFEGIYQTQSEVPMWAFGIPDDKSQSVRYGLPIPGMLSWLAKDNIHATLKGLDSFNPDVRPPTFLPFESYHLMITIGLYCIFISWLGIFCWWQKKLFENRWLLWVFILSVVGPYLANELGWIATETGRQPWLVYGLLRTSQGISPAVDSPSLIASLVIFSLLYMALFAVFIYSLNKKIQKGPQC